MPVPVNRVPVRVARGTYANLAANVSSLIEGEVCYANDEDRLYVIEGGVLVPTGAGSLSQLSDIDLVTAPPADGQVLTYDNGSWVPTTVEGATTLEELTDTYTVETGERFYHEGTHPLGGQTETGNYSIHSSSASNKGVYLYKTDANGDNILGMFPSGFVFQNGGTSGALRVSSTSGSGYTDYTWNYVTTNESAASPTNPNWVRFNFDNKPLPPTGQGDLYFTTTVSTASGIPADGQVLTWVDANSQWEPAAPGATTIDELTDVDTTTTAPTDGQVLTWVDTNSQWEPKDATGGSGSVAVINDLNDVTTGGVGDTNFANVSLLARGAAFQDDSSNNLTLTSINATLDRAVTKWGGGSYNFRTDASGIRVTYDSALDLSSGDFTVEMWAYAASDPTYRYLIVFGESDSSSGYSWQLKMSTWGSGNKVLQVETPSDLIESDPISWTDNTWHHIAFTRSGDTVRLYIDGSKAGADVNLFTGTTTPQANDDILIGAKFHSGTAQIHSNWPGYIEDVRVTKGLARYTGTTYTVPTTEFPVGTTVHAPTNGQVLTWDAFESQWEPKTAAAVVGSGAVDSVNTKTGDVSLGLIDLIDTDIAADTISRYVYLTRSTTSIVNQEAKWATPAPVSTDGYKEWIELTGKFGGLNHYAQLDAAITVGSVIKFYENATQTEVAHLTVVEKIGRSGWDRVDVRDHNDSAAHDILKNYNEPMYIEINGVVFGSTNSGIDDGFVLSYNTSVSKWEPAEHISLANLKAVVAASSTFSDFQFRISQL